MVAFTGNLIVWILCALFRVFVAFGVGYGIYSGIKKLRGKINDEIEQKRWENRKKEKEKAKRVLKMTDEQIKEEKQINGEMKFVILVIGVIIILGGIIFVIKNYG